MQLASAAEMEDCRMLPKAMEVKVAVRPSPIPLRLPSDSRAFPPVSLGSMLITLERSLLPLALLVRMVAGGGRGAGLMKPRPGRRFRPPFVAVLGPLIPQPRLLQLSIPTTCVQRQDRHRRPRFHRTVLLIRLIDDRTVPTRHLKIH